MRMKAIISGVGASVVLTASLVGGVAFAAAPSSVYVSTKNCSDSNPGTNQKPFCTVQKGVNGVAVGGTVYIANGTYNEQVTVPAAQRNVTLRGSGQNTVIAAPASMVSGKVVDLQSTGTLLDDLTVNGMVNATDCTDSIYGVYFENGASATINDSHIINAESTDPNLRGCQAGVAIRVGSQALTIAATAKINDTTVTNYAKGGIVVDGPGSSATLTDNTVTGYGPTTLVAQNGIQVGRGASATISNNTVSGNAYTGPAAGTTATGILIFEVSNVNVQQNTVNKNDVGLDIDAQNSTFAQNTVNNNTTNGFFVESTSAGDKFSQNTAKNTGGTTYYTPYDVEDDSTGSGTLHTANKWSQNTCKTSSPANLCKQ